jgi:uncharacterized phage protein gp47/JayE
MSLNLPASSAEVVKRAKTDVKRILPTSDPFLPNSGMGALVSGYGNRVFDNYIQLGILQQILMPDTSDGEYSQRWAAIYGKSLLPATQSSGNLIAGGTPGSAINIGTVLTSSTGQLYTSTASVVIATTNLIASSITRVGNLVTVITSDAHELADNIQVTVSGMLETEYNGTFDISVVDPTSFTYEITGTPTTPGTGGLELEFDSAVVPVTSDEFQDTENDVEVNLELGDTATLQSPLIGVDNDLGVPAEGVSGGTNQETLLSLRNRTIEKIQNPTANFNVAAIVDQAKEVPGVTRVFVQEVTPGLGQTTIYFMRDNDSNPIPDAGEVTTTKNKILEIKPANTSDANVIVSAPTAVTTNFVFSSLTPDTTAMRSAISANLAQFFEEETDVGVNVDADAYRAVIINTVDTETGIKLSTFTLTSPVSDIVVSAGEIAVLGTVTYP